MRAFKIAAIGKRILRQALVAVGAAALTAGFFLILPVMQTITTTPEDMLQLVQVAATHLPPPPPPPEEEAEEEPEPEPEPPELIEQSHPLDLSQLELALDPGGMGEGWMAGDFAIDLSNLTGAGGTDVDALFSLADLDQKPRAIYQPSPIMDRRIRKRAPGTVKLLFVVDQRGRVSNPIVRSSTDPVFDRAALAAVKKWKFEPGKRNGTAVRFRMLVPITFPKG